MCAITISTAVLEWREGGREGEWEGGGGQGEEMERGKRERKGDSESKEGKDVVVEVGVGGV